MSKQSSSGPHALARKGIDFIGVGVVFFCHDGKGKFVMAKRSQNPRDEKGCWDIGGGAIEWGSDVLDSLRREIAEEYSAEVKSQEFLGYRDVRRIHDSLLSHWIVLDFKVLVDPKKVAIAEPHKFDDIGWFSLGGLPNPLHSQQHNFFRKYAHRLT